MNKKIVALVLACVLMFSCIVAGTLAYLVSTTNTITNTFTFGQVGITLGETVANEFLLVPGQSYAKDPVVSVNANSEDSYVFVKVEETIADGKTFADYITYSVNAGVDKTWTALDGVANVYYVKYTKNAVKQDYYVLTGDTTYTNGVVSCPSTVTPNMIDGLDGSKPTLQFTAYAIQDEGFADAKAAWTAMTTQIGA